MQICTCALLHLSCSNYCTNPLHGRAKRRAFFSVITYISLLVQASLSTVQCTDKAWCMWNDVLSD